MNNKLFAVLAAVMMVAVVGAAMVNVSDDSDADTTNGLGDFKFFIATYEDSEWTTYCGGGYNAFIALDNTAVTYTTGNSNYAMLVNSYYTINPNYGTITSINSISNSASNVWNILIYSDARGEWILGPVDALGFYEAYNDYDSSLRTANIALYYGSSIDDMPELPTTGLNSLIDVTNSSAFQVTFNISVSSGMTKPAAISDASWTYLLANGGNYTGYGSNCFLALNNAITSTTGLDEMYNIANDSINNSSYGYISSILGVSEQSSSTNNSSTYDYWSVYLGSSIGSTNYSLYTLGFLTPVSGLGSGYVWDNICLQYTESVYTW